MSLASIAVAPAVVSGLGLPMQTHEMQNLFWERVLPVFVVLLAAAFAMAFTRAALLRRDEWAAGARPGLRRLLRGVLQALIYLSVLTGATWADKALHGDPKGLDMTLRFGSAVALLWAGFLVFDAIERQLYARFLSQGRPAAVTLIPMMDKVAKAVWAVLITILFLENMGMDVKALLAGLGVGGLAVALAGQKTMENFFGGLVLVMDQPVRAGDFCGFGDKSGEVVEVGLRSIKLRTADRTLITVPNGEFSQLVLENFAKRDRIRFNTTLALSLDTGLERLQRVLAALEALVQADPQVDTTMPRRVRFVQMGQRSLDLEVSCYFNGPDWEEFLLWQQALLQAMLGALEHEGASLAAPGNPLGPGVKV